MLRSNCSAHEKMAFIPSPPSIEWPLQIIDNVRRDEKSSLMASSLISSNNQASVMEKPAELQQQQQQQLKCPRCDSSNTKFCYYNNYSLSQPRHFCKACKRYWTRGGTLRNVPVGGGCRKNKRVKRPISSSSTTSSSTAPSSSSNPNPSLFYSLPQTTNPNSELNLQPPYNNHTRVPGYDLLPHMNGALGLGFSSSGLLTGTGGDHDHSSNSSIFSSYNIPGFGSSSSDHPTSSTPTMASLLASSLQQQRFMGGLFPFDQENSMPSAAATAAAAKDEVKMELGNHQNNNNRSSAAAAAAASAAAMDWSNFQSQLNNQQGDQIGSADPNTLLWNTAAAGIGVWQLDPTNIGSSVPSLI